MRKTCMLAMLFAMQTLAFAQIDVLSIESVPETAGKGYFHPSFAPSGDYLLLTGVNYKGLTRYDLASQKLSVLTDADNAGYEPQVSDGGKVIVFRDVEYKNNLRYTSIKSINVETGKISEVDKPAREQYPFQFVAGQVKVAKRTKMLTKRLATDIRTVENSYVVAIEDQDLVLYDGLTRKVLNPNGKGSYIWPSLSPDRKHIVYMALHKGCTTFVYDLATKNTVALGYIAAPVWLGNEWIVGMEDKDDGHQTLSSELKAAKIDGSLTQKLATPNQPIAMYPAANAVANAIAYEADGTICLMKVNVK